VAPLPEPGGGTGGGRLLGSGREREDGDGDGDCWWRRCRSQEEEQAGVGYLGLDGEQDGAAEDERESCRRVIVGCVLCCNRVNIHRLAIWCTVSFCSPMIQSTHSFCKAQ
jgi:hypothetical protein